MYIILKTGHGFYEYSWRHSRLPLFYHITKPKIIIFKKFEIKVASYD
tara:strand:- start:123 stop:263 length:141 start_codon:yes stop_codon:yes gene_type:complete